MRDKDFKDYSTLIERFLVYELKYVLNFLLNFMRKQFLTLSKRYRHLLFHRKLGYS